MPLPKKELQMIEESNSEDDDDDDDDDELEELNSDSDLDSE